MSEGYVRRQDATSQVAAGVLAPDVARSGLAARTEVAAAHIKPTAGAATSLHELLLAAQQIKQ